MGVWIETSLMLTLEMASAVTPCVGVWIETIRIERYGSPYFVTPCVGVWIETKMKDRNGNKIQSHPAWVCGLKLILRQYRGITPVCHTLRGCVD